MIPNKSTTPPPNPNFKQTELGWIPKDWEVKKVHDFIKLTSGKTKPKDLNENFDNIPVYGGNGIIGYTKKLLISGKNLVIGRVGEYCGVTRFIDNDAWITDNALYTKNKSDNFYLKWMAYYFQFYKLSRLRNKGGQPLISQSPIHNLKLKLPPLPEQKAIADCLSTWDKAISKQQQLITAKQEQHKGLRHLLLTGKKRLTNPETGKVFDEEWVEKRLGEISSSFSGGTPSSKVKEYYNGNIHWLKSGELNQIHIKKTEKYISKLGLENSSSKIVKPNTILIAMYGATAGVCAITEIEGAINQAVLAIKPSEEINNLFLFYKMKMIMPSMVQRLTQGGQPNLNGGIIKNIKVNIPLLKEQTAIAEVLETSSNEIELLQQQLNQLQLQKKGLMQVLLSGALRLRSATTQ